MMQFVTKPFSNARRFKQSHCNRVYAFIQKSVPCLSAFAILFTSVALAKEAPQAHKAIGIKYLPINDHHSYLEPHRTRINLNGQQTKWILVVFLLSMQT